MSVDTEQQASFTPAPEQEHIPYRRERGPNYEDTYRAMAALSLQVGNLEDRQTYLFWAEENTPPTKQ